MWIGGFVYIIMYAAAAVAAAAASVAANRTTTAGRNNIIWRLRAAVRCLLVLLRSVFGFLFRPLQGLSRLRKKNKNPIKTYDNNIILFGFSHPVLYSWCFRGTRGSWDRHSPLVLLRH